MTGFGQSGPLAAQAGPLRLDGLAAAARLQTAISDPLAAALARHVGPLDLDRLTALSDVAAAALAGHDGDLSLAGLTRLTPAAARAFSCLRLVRRDGAWGGLTKLRHESLRIKVQRGDADGSALRGRTRQQRGGGRTVARAVGWMGYAYEKNYKNLIALVL